jgi:hypothetical protein
MIELSKQIGDYWASTTTSSGSSTTVIDTALSAKANDWISDAPQEMYDRITSGTYDNEERKISSLDNTTVTLTTLAHGGTIASAVTYEVHRLFNASEKRRALVYAAHRAFPDVFTEVKDTSLTIGNWLIDGDLENGWSSSSANSYWTASGSTITKTTTAKYFKRSATSMKIDTAAGYVYQDWSLNDDLKELRGKQVTFSAEVWCDTASCLRLAIYDGTDITYSDYHDGDSTWADEPLDVTVTISETATDVAFRIYHAVAAGTSYVDDLRVTGPERDKLYIGNLGLAHNRPHMIEMQHDNYIQFEPWLRLHNYEIKSDGYLYLHEGEQDYRLRISGIGYLDFLASGASSTDWAATIAIDSPQTDILVAEAIVYLYTQMIMPNYTSGEREAFLPILQYWEKELDARKAKYGMFPPPATVRWE